MAGLKAVTRPTRQNGKEALLLEIDYHYADRSEARRRVEVFVAGKAGHVHQLLFDTVATRERLAEQKELLAAARAAQLLIDTSVRGREGAGGSATSTVGP